MSKKRDLYLCSNILLTNYKHMNTWLNDIACSLKYQVLFNIFKMTSKKVSYVGGHILLCFK